MRFIVYGLWFLNLIGVYLTKKLEIINGKLNIQDFSNEISFQTTRSGGKGGQNVNKVETAVIAYLNTDSSLLLTDEQKLLLKEKLANRINADGLLFVKSQAYRTQLENKEDAAKKINELIYKALQKKKKRVATKPSKQAKEKRLEGKKQKGEIKGSRKKIRYKDL